MTKSQNFISKIYVVGLGPGKSDFMTFQAKTALENSQLIVGYTKYIDLIKDEFKEKDFFDNGMMKETERCAYALEQASSGKIVSVVCSGDSGVYGMASLVLELSVKYKDIEIEIVPGVTAALSGSSKLGSPFTADFCVVSLSNLLTPQTTIEKRLRAAAEGDFPMAIYNPRSRNRPDVLKNACEILLEKLSPETVCGWVRNIGRNGEEYRICTLKELMNEELDMFCTVFVGNSQTQIIESAGRKWMVNSRGYGRVER